MVRWLVLGVVLLGAAHLVLHLVEAPLTGALGVELTRWLDINSETSVATWFNIGLLQLGAMLMVVACAASPVRERAGWAGLSVGLLLLSLDEKILIHERLPALLGMEHGSLPTHEWLLPGVLIALAALCVLLVLVRPLPGRVRMGLLLALVVYGSGAVGMELLSGLGVRQLDSQHLVRQLMPVWEWIEESLEMLGCVLAVATVLEHLERIGLGDAVRSARRAAGSPSRRR